MTKFYTTSIVARRFGVTPARVQQLTREGRLPVAAQAAKQNLYDPDAIEQLAQERERRR